MTRSIAFVALRVLELLVATFGCLAPFTCALVLVVLERALDGLRPEYVDPRTDLRAYYPAVSGS